MVLNRQKKKGLAGASSVCYVRFQAAIQDEHMVSVLISLCRGLSEGGESNGKKD